LEALAVLLVVELQEVQAVVLLMNTVSVAVQ
jgi:hypothetical protein